MRTWRAFAFDSPAHFSSSHRTLCGSMVRMSESGAPAKLRSWVCRTALLRASRTGKCRPQWPPCTHRLTCLTEHVKSNMASKTSCVLPVVEAATTASCCSTAASKHRFKTCFVYCPWHMKWTLAHSDALTSVMAKVLSSYANLAKDVRDAATTTSPNKTLHIMDHVLALRRQ